MAYQYYLGATSPGGFAGFFDTLASGEKLKLYIIKSGPGSGKSSLMKRLAARLESRGLSRELIRCSSDPDSLDGLICRERGFAIIDGTAPHVVEPSIPAARERVLSLYDTIDSAALSQKLTRLESLFSQNAALHARAKSFIAAAGSLARDLMRAATGCFYEDKARRYARSLAAKLLPPLGGEGGAERLRVLSAATPKGLYGFAAENASLCERAYVFDDRFGALAALLLSEIRDAALRAGYGFTACRSFLNPYESIDALFFEEQSLCFINGALLDTELPHAKRIRDARFYSVESLAGKAKRLSFEKKAARSLLEEAARLLAEAKAVHDEIESHYSAAVDFELLREREEKLYIELGV
ncbi:MAG: hypothetical protein Q4B42_00135 [Oscillospiraceae bacterium]|nr:hypothetical protein [Oscillospiraceae bacterium]